jgi:hypothetical protein
MAEPQQLTQRKRTRMMGIQIAMTLDAVFMCDPPPTLPTLSLEDRGAWDVASAGDSAVCTVGDGEGVTLLSRDLGLSC